MKEITLYSSSAEKIKNSLTTYKGSEKQKIIGEEMQKLAKILLELKNLDITRSIFSSFPLIGPWCDNIKREHIENKYSDSKVLIDTLTTELSKKCAELRQDDLQLEPLIDALKLDISNNKAVLKELQEEYKKLCGKDYDENDVIVLEKESTETTEIDKIELNNKLVILAHSMSKVMSLIKNQAVYLAQLTNIKTQNMTFIQSITTDIKTSVSSIATGVIVANHLNKRNELMEITRECNLVASEMVLKTSQAMKEQTDNYKKLLIENPLDDKKLDEAILLVKETYDDFHNFASIEMPKILEDLSSKSESITNLVYMIESSDNVYRNMLPSSK